MTARGWIDRADVEAALIAAAATCGLNADDGEEATRKTIQSGLDSGEKRPHPGIDTNQQDGFTELPPISGSWKYHTGEAPTPPRWLIKSILPETGPALMSGQWGTFKTTVALDLSVCVMGDLPFAGRYRVKRPGAVLYLALEGSGMLCTRLSAIAAHHGVPGRCRLHGETTAHRSRTKTPPTRYAVLQPRRPPTFGASLIYRLP